MGSPRIVLEKLDLNKIPYSTNIKPKYKPDEKLLKLKPVVIGVFAKGAGGGGSPPSLKKFGQNAQKFGQ